MTMTIETERALLGNTNFDRRDVDRLAASEKQSFAALRFKDGPGAKQYQQAIEKLDALRSGGWRQAFGSDYLTETQRAEIRGAVQDVGNARLFAQRENLASDQLTRNAGDDPGIYRDRQSGEIVRRDPGARTREEKTTTIQNRDEPGINRDPLTGRIVSREPGAKTIVERGDESERYLTSGKKTYRPGASSEELQSGRTLREGDYGDGVREMQRLLKAAGYNPGTLDGFFGPSTAKAVKRFLADQKSPRSDMGAEELARLAQLAKEKKA